MLTLLQKHHTKGDINMAMGALYNRQGEWTYLEERAAQYRLVAHYFETLEWSGRFHFEYAYDYTVQCLKEWNHRFVGVTEDGKPIWLSKRRALRYSGSEVCWYVIPRNHDMIFNRAGQCDSEAAKSFFEWRRNRHRTQLAFIYMGIFWILKKGESLNDAAKRFIETHDDVKALFDKRREKEEYHWIGEDKIYLYELFKDGAAVFNDDMMLVCGQELYDTPSTLWWIMASEGYFTRENIRIAKTVSAESLIAMM